MSDLFDALEDDWQEVPQARFLSWTVGEQMAYCAARDIDSAAQADTAEEIDWYLERARSYQEMTK